MTHDQFFKTLKMKEIRQAYLFCGVEQHIKASALQALRAQLLPEGFEQLNESVFEGSVTAEEIIESAETLPLMCERRLVVVKDWPPLISGKARAENEETERMLGWLKHMPDTCCLVFYLTDMPDTRKKLGRELKTAVENVQFDLLSDADLLRWCNQQLKEHGQQISQEACDRLIFMAGRMLTTLAQELNKLSAYAGEMPLIETEDVEAVVTPSTECTVFQMIDCVLRRQGAQAQMLLKNMLENGESRIGALAMLTRQMRMLTHIRLMREEGMTLAEIEKKLSLNHYAAGRAAGQAGKFSVESLEMGYRACVETDFAIKSGRIREDIALDMLMLRLADMK